VHNLCQSETSLTIIIDLIPDKFIKNQILGAPGFPACLDIYRQDRLHTSNIKKKQDQTNDVHDNPDNLLYIIDTYFAGCIPHLRYLSRFMVIKWLVCNKYCVVFWFKSSTREQIRRFQRPAD